MVKVTFDKIQKAFGQVVAIPDLNLEIGSGEFVSLLGPSGCGKTTTLRMLAGLEQPTGGEIRIGDRPVNNMAPGERDIAMVFQSYALYPHMTVSQNIAYPLKKRGVPKSEHPARIKVIADLLQLGPLLDRRPKQLSGGQQQRVALGRALVRDPKVFLLDEPLSNLDAKLRAHMRAELIELHRRLGKTMVYVTHDQLEAMTMSTRIAVMHGGNLQQFGTPSEIYNRPRNVFVASFIGTPSMTLVEATIRAGEGAWHLSLGDHSFALPPGLVGPDARAERPIMLGIRPEDILLGDPGASAKATVRLVEPTGHESIVTLDVGGANLVVRAAGDVVLTIGETVPFRLRLDRLHVFDRDSGIRINTDETRPAEFRSTER